MSTSVVPSAGGSPLQSGQGFSGAEWGAPPPPERGNAAIQQLITRTLAAVKRYRWLILAIFVIGSAAGVAASRLIKPKFAVDATIWISQSGGRSGPVQAPGLISSDLGWTDLIRSFAILDPVVSELALYVTPTSGKDTLLFRGLMPTDSLVPGLFRLKLGQNGSRYQLVQLAEQRGEVERVVENGAVGDSIGRAVGFAWHPDRKLLQRTDQYDFEIVTPREAAVTLQADLVVGLPQNSNLMRLGLRGEHSLLLAETMNHVLRRFEREAQRLKKENLVDVANTIDEQLKRAADDLYSKESALESFKINTITQPSDNVAIQPGVSMATSPVMAAYFADKTTLESVRRDRDLLERIVGEGSARNGRLSSEALRAAPSILVASETGKELATAINDLSLRQVNLRTLRERYTDEHQLVKQELTAINALEGEVIPGIANRLLVELRSRETEMTRRVDGASAELRKIPQRTIEEARRNRDVAVATTIFQDLQSRAVAARLSEQTVMPDIAILDTAVAPRLPTSDTTLSLIAMAVIASLGAGVALAILLDRLDGRFRYPEQAVNDLGLDIVGAVPSYTAPRSQRARLEQASQMVESFRSLALSVRASFPPGTPVQLTVSSPGPGDGKSTISINLANALAEGGYRTLLIDGDIRRGQLHESCPPAAQSPGLLDYLAGEATLGEVVKTCDLHVNLSLVPCGTRRRQGPELLASQRMGNMLRELRSQFDAIVVDCAPLGAGIDAYALGSATGSMLLVLRAGETDRRLASARLSTLDRMPIRILGTVLNDIGESPEFRYYHYLDGYGTPETLPDVALIGSSGTDHR
ncbi:MAG: polysaccharide biosynthesis tyrosine autokinase [Gemmatimonadaceae bacterium]|nr:polysaccharide biosynthesis tyrosine autokinase [Gemmatimonadaceae bacterium]